MTVDLPTSNDQAELERDTGSVTQSIRILHVVEPEIVKTDVANFRSVVHELTGQKRSAMPPKIENRKRRQVSQMRSTSEAWEDYRTSRFFTYSSLSSSCSSLASVEAFQNPVCTCTEKPSSSLQRTSSLGSDLESSYEGDDLSFHLSFEQVLESAIGKMTEKPGFSAVDVSTNSVMRYDSSISSTICQSPINGCKKVDILPGLSCSELKLDRPLSGGCSEEHTMWAFPDFSDTLTPGIFTFNEMNTCSGLIYYEEKAPCLHEVGSVL